jgi:hypothetical protein
LAVKTLIKVAAVEVVQAQSVETHLLPTPEVLAVPVQHRPLLAQASHGPVEAVEAHLIADLRGQAALAAGVLALELRLLQPLEQVTPVVAGAVVVRVVAAHFQLAPEAAEDRAL